MSQKDYTITDQTHTNFRQTVNDILAAIASQNSGATEPTVKYAYMWWADTTTGLLKIRNAANDAWITVGTLASVNFGLLSLAGGSLTGTLSMSTAVINEAKGSNVASASSCDIWGAGGNATHITGVADINNFATAPQAGAVRKIIADGTFKLKHNTSYIINPSGTDITCAVGDSFFVYADTTTKCYILAFQRADGTALVSSNTKLAGDIVQVVNSQTSDVATGTTVTLYDDSIMQNTEGDQYLTCAITPTNTNNKLLIFAELNLSHSYAGSLYMMVGLFKDSVADALKMSIGWTNSATVLHSTVLIHYMTAGTTDAITLKIRAGGHQSGTTTFNGAGGGRLGGGVLISSITIMEIKV